MSWFLQLLQKYLSLWGMLVSTVLLTNTSYLWCVRPGRTLPFWPIKPAAPLSKWLFDNPRPNAALILLLYILLILSLLDDRALLPATILFGLLLVVDQYRLFYTHYWFVCFAAFLFKDPTYSIQVCQSHQSSY